MRKRLLSILLCLVMVTGLFPTVAFAADKTADGMTQELADLREIVFNQQQEMPAEDAAGIKMVFPYRLSRRVVAFGGHDSWLREIKFKVPDVRFMGEIRSNGSVVKAESFRFLCNPT